MKKTLMIALAGMMLFAFTQCGGKVAKGSKEYQDNMELYNKLEKSIKDAKNSCRQLISFFSLSLIIYDAYPTQSL